jgi:hypothetical protein
MEYNNSSCDSNRDSSNNDKNKNDGENNDTNEINICQSDGCDVKFFIEKKACITMHSFKCEKCKNTFCVNCMHALCDICNKKNIYIKDTCNVCNSNNIGTKKRKISVETTQAYYKNKLYLSEMDIFGSYVKNSLKYNK